MLSKDSILRRLPRMGDRDQVLFLDGIRHAAEMADIGYRRLARTLTALANSYGDDKATERRSQQIPAAFLYAWSVVDALYRMKGLFELYPHQRSGEEPVPGAGKAAREAFEAVALVRNVSDHIAARVPHVRATNGAALGVLTWCTAHSMQEMLSCAIYPGTMPDKSSFAAVNPAGKEIDWPTGLVTLRAGAHAVNLSSTVNAVRRLVSSLERDVEAQLIAHGYKGECAGTDLFVAMTMRFDEMPEVVVRDALGDRLPAGKDATRGDTDGA